MLYDTMTCIKDESFFLGDSIGGFHMLFVLKDRHGMWKFRLYYHLTVFCVHYATIKTHTSNTDAHVVHTYIYIDIFKMLIWRAHEL